MHPLRLLFICICCSLLFSCAVSNKNYNPEKKFTRQELQQDYTLLRNILEQKHPALYWYTPKDSMNFYFDSLYNNIADSMTELQFGWKVLAPLTQKIRCGHTSFRMSDNWRQFVKDKVIPSFPLQLKIWGDTMVVVANQNKKDSVLKPGTVISSINNQNSHEIIQTIFKYLPLDGYATNGNYIRISSNFPYYHRNVFGIFKNYRVGYIDSAGNEKKILIPLWSPKIDSTKKNKIEPFEKISKRQFKKMKIDDDRFLSFDSSLQTATLIINTFSSGAGRHLRSFIKKSFKQIEEQQSKNLILDLRSNGGGDINMYVLLAKYISNKSFKVADTAYSISKNFSPYNRYIKNACLSNFALLFLSKKRSDGNYHFGYWERHLFKPKSNHHFNGKVYVLINGATFSASTLFCNTVKGQENISLVGEETGGGWHGNTGIFIPDITLPVTKLKVRLPFFRLVQYQHVPKNGSGVIPDISIPPTVEGIRKKQDRKMLIVKEWIRQGKQ